MWNARLNEAQTGIKIAGRSINNLRYADTTTLMAESEEELKSLLIKVKKESEKVGLKLNSQKTKIMASNSIISWQIRWGNNGNGDRVYFGGSQITTVGECSHEFKRHSLLGRKAMTNLDSTLKCRDIADKSPSSQSYGFASSHVCMWELEYKESWTQKNWCFWTMVLEKTLENSFYCKEIKPVHLKGNQSWIFTGSTEAEAETPILRPSDVKDWLTGKDPDDGKDWRWEEKGTTEDDTIGWHHQVDRHESE